MNIKRYRSIRIERTARVLAALLAVWLMIPAASAEEGSRGVLYRAAKGAQTAYLLGSIHIGSEGMYPFGAEIAAAMEAADAFVFECDTADASAQARLSALLPLPANETLADHIGEELFARVSAAYRALGLSTAALANTRPWAVVSTLATYSTAAEMGMDNIARATELGVETQVRAYLAGAGKPALYLETIEEQIGVMDGFSDALQRYLLMGECDLLDHPDAARGMDATVASWPEWWRAGDTSAFVNAYLSGYPDAEYIAESTEYHQSLVVARNRLMADRLRAMLEAEPERTLFATVGLLHLVLPEESLVTMLRERGYTVERISQP